MAGGLLLWFCRAANASKCYCIIFCRIFPILRKTLFLPLIRTKKPRPKSRNCKGARLSLGWSAVGFVV